MTQKSAKIFSVKNRILLARGGGTGFGVSTNTRGWVGGVTGLGVSTTGATRSGVTARGEGSGNFTGAATESAGVGVAAGGGAR